jgi:hypothetical protein
MLTTTMYAGTRTGLPPCLNAASKLHTYDFFVQSSTGDVSSVGGNGKGQEFVIVQEWISGLLIDLEVPNTN